MAKYRFNSDAYRETDARDVYISDDQIEGTPNLRRASLSDAILFGGPAVRDLLERAPIVGDREYVFVDTKVSMLMPGWYPAIPGWHTDGVPRGDNGHPSDYGHPSLPKQLTQRSPRFHTIIAGNPCLTEFLKGDYELEIEHDQDNVLYSEMTNKVEELAGRRTRTLMAPKPQVWASWDWWQIHRAGEANRRGWRLLIRITESDLVRPATRDFIRTQNQVYVPLDSSW
ncbi:hypothetical protein SEA_LOZINAK_75 [Gordonia phage Lozinak]|uniref:Uncharacterized protein n=4 Tax=Smoothievirus TaxID=1982557 RepID=A0A2D1GFS0_9CAUD|nr:hypothetical protein BEN60_gp131 [Gordonia phage Smoothie]YP_009276187.1 hypothetical protein BH772_gp135 [Gordonia phage Bachita]YP_009281230.1 hypothetical protein BIZ74_gp129 [Gordonia phage Cucurbita]ATN90701.1 hypothetical protein SEA_LOZINAK_75 [Gordonia phage Lozinak]AUE23644.1 hypothetical protein SEA_TONIANN_75 [Gordonia phage Toniann]QAU06939.1 hypothetical protein SEA_APHELION_74 [Gordonia phage Aphelion]QKY79652.1 hypothetical protein SEA_ENGINEER_76 [Gordonia Phage Engineer]Q